MEKKQKKRIIQSLDYHDIQGDDREKTLQLVDDLITKRASMSKEEIMTYAKTMRPVFQNGELYWLKSCHIASESCFYRREFLYPAIGLQEIARITTYHSYSYLGCLCPSADEAIWQCPKEILGKACAFTTFTENLNINVCLNNIIDRHVCTTIYYSGILPEEISAPEIKW